MKLLDAPTCRLSTSEGMASNSLSNSKCKSRSQASHMDTNSLSNAEVCNASFFLSCYEELGLTHRKYKLLSAHHMISYCDIWGVLQQQFYHGKVTLMYSTVKTSLALQHITESGHHATRQTGALHTFDNLMDACRALTFGMTDDQASVTGACACSS